jgi:tripartite-type tricarboxylate transporter receptor subunit TctC
MTRAHILILLREERFMRHLIATLAAALSLAAASTVAQPFPTKPVKVIVAYAPGGPNDGVARIVGERLSGWWSKTVPGAAVA